MRDKLQHLINSESNLTRSGFAEMLGIQPATISHILAGRNKPSYELLQKILLRFPNVSADWLMLDRGEMLRNPLLTPSGLQRADAELLPSDGAGSLSVASDNFSAAAAPAVQATDGLQGSFFDNRDYPHTERPHADGRITEPAKHFADGDSDISAADNLTAAVSQLRAGANVERVVVFYSDKTFETYIPRK